jgi:hypothetical protein
MERIYWLTLHRGQSSEAVAEAAVRLVSKPRAKRKRRRPPSPMEIFALVNLALNAVALSYAALRGLQCVCLIGVRVIALGVHGALLAFWWHDYQRLRRRRL